MSARLIKAGELHTLSAFNPPGPETIQRQAPPASVPYSLPPPTAHPNPAANGVAGTERTALAENFATDAVANADKIVRAARVEAAALVAAAQTRAGEIERTARERGRAEAQAQAQIEQGKAVEDLRARLTASLDGLAGLRAELAARWEQDLVRLALEIAKKVVQREVKVDREVALTLARVALGRLHSRASATVRLHPDDYAYVWAHRERLSGDATVEIVEDRAMEPGGCVVQSDTGEIDARIGQQFAEIERDFLSA